MNFEQAFSFGNLWVMPFWLLMIAFPWWSKSESLMRGWFGWLGILLPAVLYTALILPTLGSLMAIVSQPKLSVLAPMLATPEGTTIAWLHFLAFDLFVGRWVFLDGRERQISAWFLSPILFLCLMLAPLGLLSYLLLRSFFPSPQTPATAS